ncbi:MAG: ATP synthase F0 sector subunit c, partial [uncultured Phycisphaerae bacterium]
EEDLRSRRAGAAGPPGNRVGRRRHHHAGRHQCGRHLGQQPRPGHPRRVRRGRAGHHRGRDGHREDRRVGHRGDRPPARGRSPHLHHHDHRGRPHRRCDPVRAGDLPHPERRQRL